MIRVLHVLGHVPIGGIGTYLINTLRYIDPQKIKFDFVMFNSNYESNFANKVVSLGGNVIVFNSYLKAVNIIKMAKELNDYLTNHGKYDIVHLHAPNLGFMVFPLAIIHGIKFRILHSHTVKYSDTYIKSIRNFIIGLPSKVFATNYIACSIDAGKFLFGHKDFFIARNGIEINKYKYNPEMRIKLRNYYKIQDKIVVGHVGNFMPTKNHEFLIDIFEKLYDKNKDFVLFLIGEGPLESKIKVKVKESNFVNAVKFLGRWDNVNDLMQMLDVLGLPSKNEGFGFVAIEAQISGLLCFISDKFPNEVKVTNYINCLSLDLSPEDWAIEIFNNVNYLREDQSNKIAELGYNAQSAAQLLEDYYINILKA